MIKAQSHKLVNTQLGDSDLFAKWIEIVSKGTSLFSFICVSYFFFLLSYGFFQKHILQAVLFKVASSGLQRGSFCPFPFLLIYYYGSNKSTEKETGKTHLGGLSGLVAHSSIFKLFMKEWKFDLWLKEFKIE